MQLSPPLPPTPHPGLFCAFTELMMKVLKICLILIHLPLTVLLSVTYSCCFYIRKVVIYHVNKSMPQYSFFADTGLSLTYNSISFARHQLTNGLIDSFWPVLIGGKQLDRSRENVPDPKQRRIISLLLR